MEKKSILIVDDDAGHLELLRRVIGDERPQINVAVASDVDEFNRQIRNAEFDCVIIDFHLAGCTAEELIHNLRRRQPDCPAIIISGDDDQEVAVRSLRNGGADFVHKDRIFEGKVLWQRIERAMANHRLLTQERRKVERREQQLIELAETDPLTGLANRRWAARMFAADGRNLHDRRGCSSAIMLDIDHFKDINDRHGHLGGDQVLKALAGAIKSVMTQKDTTVRWGGEEFLIIKHDTPFANAVAWAESLRDEIEMLPIPFNGQSIALTASLGIAHVPSCNFKEATVAQADEALYLAKKQGRNRVVTWEMVEFEQIARSTPGDEPVGRLHGVLQQCRNFLGPTQLEHLTLHSHRVSRCAIRIARMLCLESEMVYRLRVAGICHDLGKFIIPEDILSKPTVLSRDERILLDRHARDGADMSRLLGADADTVEFVGLHHRRFDDPPSPQGAPLGARILSASDAFEAMTSDRPYQPPRTRAAALEELDLERGRQFDPAVVDAAKASLL